jgi:drug/metabolite transporter (DMT)-like permease
LQHTGAAGASLLLNFEAVFTVVLGWFVVGVNLPNDRTATSVWLLET